MAGNPFDQFDAPTANPFDRFDPGAKQPEEQGDFVRGARVAFGQTGPILKGLVGLGGATLEKAVGEGGIATGIKNWGLRGFEEGMQKLQPLQKETDELTTSWERAKEGDLGALVDWAQYGLGYAMGQGGEAVAMSLVGGAVGAAAGGAASAGAAAPAGGVAGAITGLVAKGAVKDAAQSLIQKAVAKEAAALMAAGKLTAEQAVKQATTNIARNIGSTSALLAFGGAQELGSIYPEAEAEAAKRGEELTGGDLARVWATGIAAGGIEGLTDKLGVDALLGKVRIPGLPSRAGSALATGAAGAGVEGVTEAAQTAIERVGADQEVLGDGGTEAIINAAGLGALGGAAIGGAVGAARGPSVAAAARARSDQAFEDIATAQTPDDTIEAFTRTYVPPIPPAGLDGDGAMTRLERQRDEDVKGLRDFEGRTPEVPKLDLSSTPTQASDASVTELPEEPFSDRLLTLREKLKDSRNRQQVRDKLGPEALNDILYYAQRADDASLPGKTSDNMLALAEAMLSRAEVQPLEREVIAADKRAERQAKLAARAPAPQIGLDTTPTGRIRVDSGGTAAPEVRADQISLADRARAMAARRDGMTEATPRDQVHGAGPGVMVGEGELTTAGFPAPAVPRQIEGPDWRAFPDESGTLGIPRAEMPQVKAEHRGPMVNFLEARGVTHDQTEEVDPASLKATQAEFSLSKVQKAKDFQGDDRSILVSDDGYVLDGHHQWLAKLDDRKPVRVIRLNAPIRDLVALVREFPSSTLDTQSPANDQASNDENAGVRGVAAREAALQQPAGQGISPLRGQGDQGESAVGERLRGVLSGGGPAADAATLAGQNQGAPRLPTGQRPVGDEGTAGAEPAGIRASGDAQRAHADSSGVGSRVGDAGNNDLQKVERRQGTGTSTDAGPQARRGSTSDADSQRADVAAQGVGARTRNGAVDDSAALESGVAGGAGANASLKERADALKRPSLKDRAEKMKATRKAAPEPAAPAPAADTTEGATDAQVATVPAGASTGVRPAASDKRTLQEKVERPVADGAVVATVGDPQAEGDRKFYVTMVRGDRVARLAGPFDTKDEADAMVDRARTAANEADPRSSFDAFGVSGITSKEHKPGTLNERLGIGADEQDRQGLRAADRNKRDVDAAAAELSGQIANDMLDGQYATPADRAEMAPGLKLVADQAGVPVDDLRQAVLKQIAADERLTKRQTKQIMDALDPTKVVEAPAAAPAKPEPAAPAPSVEKEAKAEPAAPKQEAQPKPAEKPAAEAKGAAMPSVAGIPRDVAQQAHAGTSHVPERRAEQEQQSFMSALRDAWDRAAKIAGTDEAAIDRITEVFKDVADGYRARYLATLGARSRVMSSMIAGPARFPVERNRKRMETERKRSEEASQFLERGIKRLLRAARGPIDNSPESELERVRLNLSQREETQEQMKATNVALRKGDDDALKELGYTDAEIAELKKPDFAGRKGFPDYKLVNNSAEIRRLRERLKDAESRMEDAAAGPTEREVAGVRVVEDATADRLRLYFDGKPSEEVRDALKANGFRWSPKEGAWQRQLTGNARAAADAVLKKIDGDLNLSIADDVDATQAEPDNSGYGPASPEHQRLAAEYQQRLQGRFPGTVLHAVDPGEGARGRGAAVGAAERERAGVPAQGRGLQAVATVAKRLFGHEVVFVRFDGKPLFNGAMSDEMPGVIFLNADSKKPLLAVLGHELVHRMSADQKTLYALLARRLNTLLKNEDKFVAWLDSKYTPEQRKGLKYGEELHADVVGDFFTDPQFWSDMAAEQPGLFKRVAQAIIRFLDTAIQKITDIRPFGTEQYLTDLNAARAAVADAMRQFSGAQVGGMTSQSDGINLSIADTLTNGLNSAREAKLPADGLRTAQDLIDAKGGVFDFNRAGSTGQGRLRTVMDGSRPFWLGALTRDQIADIYGKEIAPVKEYDSLTRSMENERQKLAQEADDLYNEWAKLDPKVNDRLARIMLDATVHQVHPDGEFTGDLGDVERFHAHARVSAAYKFLPKNAQAMYGKVKAFHEQTLTKLRESLEGRITRQVENGKARAAALTDIRKMFDKYLESGPYFPLSRFGDFIVIGSRADGERVVASYETAGEQAAAARALEADDFTVKMKTSKTYSREMDGSAGKFIGDVLSSVGNLDFSEATVGGKASDLKAQMLDDLNQMFIRALPDLSYRKHFLHRKNTPGFSSDVMRGFASSAFHSASHIARLNHGDQMTFALQDAYKAIETAPEGDFNQHTQVLNELSKRHDAALNPNTHPLTALLNQIGFVMYLAMSPAAGLINALQTVMVTMPHLGARYGFGKANASLAGAYKDILAAPPNAKNGWNAAQSTKLTAEERKVMSTLQDEGVIDLTQANDLAAATSLDTGNVARSKAAFAMAKAMKIVGWTFHIPEVMNRQVTALSAYRLEMSKSGDEAAAMDAAREAIKRTQFDYSASNRARFMQGNLARVATQFKQYSQNMTYLLGRAAYQALKGESPEVKAIARRQLVATLGVTFGMAGALGLPGIGGVMGLIGAMVGAMDDDDEPWDWKVEFRNLMADTFGKEVGEVISKGIPRALMPWDIAGRTGMADLWWRSNDREGQNPREAFANDMQNILGPTAGTVLGLYTAADHMARGNWSKAAESIVPKALRDPLKAIREGAEGVTNYNGEPLMDVSGLEIAGRALGFAPARAAEMFEARNAVKNAETALNEKRQRLLSTMVKARMDRDAEAVAEIQADISEFNQRNPAFKITGMTVARSLLNKQRNRANTEDGIQLPKTKNDLREIGRFAA